MRTIELDCMIDEGILTDKRIENYTLARDGASDANRLKAKLIVELPEKKIEITEMEFDEACIRSSKNSFSWKLNTYERMKIELGF